MRTQLICMRRQTTSMRTHAISMRMHTCPKNPNPETIEQKHKNKEFNNLTYSE